MNATASRGVGALGLTVIALAVAGPSAAYTGQELAGKAKITIEQARAIALKAHPGQITDEELERERGGSGLRYSFDIKNGARHARGRRRRKNRAGCSRTKPKVPTPIDTIRQGRSRSRRGRPPSRRDGAIMNEAVKATLSKVPEVTLGFWIIKIIATTIGETGGDAVTMSLLHADKNAQNGGYLIGDGHIHGHVHCGRDRPDRDEEVSSLQFIG